MNAILNDARILMLDLVAMSCEDVDMLQDEGREHNTQANQDSCNVFFEKSGRTKATVLPQTVSERDGYVVASQLFDFEEVGTIFFTGHLIEKASERSWKVSQHDTCVITRPDFFRAFAACRVLDNCQIYLEARIGDHSQRLDAGSAQVFVEENWNTRAM